MKPEDPKAPPSTSLDHRQHEQVHKDKPYFHAEQASEEFEDDTQLEVISVRRLLSEDSQDATAALIRGLSTIGFVYLSEHGIDPCLFEAAHRRTVEFFENTPEEEKQRFLAQRHGSVNQGYFPFKKTTGIHPDLVEGWVFATRAFNLADRPDVDETLVDFWPSLDDERFFRRLYTALEPLALPLMQSILRHFDCPTDLYDKKLENPLCAIRLNHYPALSQDDERLGAARLLGHEDVTLFTLLPASPVEGLQVLNHQTGRWIRLIPPAGTIILNAGDYLQRITNDTLRSSTHRVSPPREARLRGQPRTSCPLFVYLREEEMVEVLPGLENPHYEPIQALTFHTNITPQVLWRLLPHLRQ